MKWRSQDLILGCLQSSDPSCCFPRSSQPCCVPYLLPGVSCLTALVFVQHGIKHAPLQIDAWAQIEQPAAPLVQLGPRLPSPEDVLFSPERSSELCHEENEELGTLLLEAGMFLSSSSHLKRFLPSVFPRDATRDSLLTPWVLKFDTPELLPVRTSRLLESHPEDTGQSRPQHIRPVHGLKDTLV